MTSLERLEDLDLEELSDERLERAWLDASNLAEHSKLRGDESWVEGRALKVADDCVAEQMKRAEEPS